MSESARFGKTNSLEAKFSVGARNQPSPAALRVRAWAQQKPLYSSYDISGGRFATALRLLADEPSALQYKIKAQSMLTADSRFFGGSSPLYKIFSRKSPEGGAVNFDAAFD